MSSKNIFRTIEKVRTSKLDNTKSICTLNFRNNKKEFLSLLFAISIFLTNCSLVNDKAKYKEEIIKSISTFIKSEDGFISLEKVDLLQFEEIEITNSKELRTKQNYKAWKTQAKIKHTCNGCLIQGLVNNIATFIITMDESKHFIARLSELSNNSEQFAGKPGSDEKEAKFRYTHITGVKLNDENPYIWTNEEYCFPRDMQSTDVEIKKINNQEIDQKEDVIQIFGQGLFVTWYKKDYTLRFTNAWSGEDISIKKGDSPISFEDNFDSTEGRIVKLTIE